MTRPVQKPTSPRRPKRPPGRVKMATALRQITDERIWASWDAAAAALKYPRQGQIYEQVTEELGVSVSTIQRSLARRPPPTPPTTPAPERPSALDRSRDPPSRGDTGSFNEYLRRMELRERDRY